MGYRLVGAMADDVTSYGDSDTDRTAEALIRKQ